MISFVCTGCGKALKVKEEFGGKKGKCPHCGQAMRVPLGSAATEAFSPSPPRAELKKQSPRSLAASDNADLETLVPTQSLGGQPPGISEPASNPTHPLADSLSPELYDFLAPAQGSDELGRLGSYRVL